MEQKKNINKHSQESKTLPFLENQKSIIVFLAFLCVLVYGSTLFFHFTQFDDDTLITKNMNFLRYLSNFGSVFQQSYFSYFYRPLVTLSYFTDTQIGGDSPILFHITNVILHILVCSFTFLVIDKLQSKRWISFVGATLFAVLPIATQAVAWIPGRTDSLLAVFIISSLYLFLKYTNTTNIKFLIGHLILFWCALLSNETAIVFPFIAGIFIFREKKKEKSATFPLLIGWGISIALWYLLRSSIITTTEGQGTVFSFGTMVINLRVILEVLGKTILPVSLSALPSFSTFSAVIGITTGIFILLLILQKQHTVNKKLILFGALWFIGFLLPSIGMKVPDSNYKFDYLENHAYTALFGIMLIISELIRVWIHSFKRREIIIFVGITSIFAIITVSHSQNFSNPINTWTHITKSSPTISDGFFQLGTIYEDSTKLAPAESCYVKATHLAPEDVRYHNNLGSVYAKSGKFQLAAQEFFKSLGIDSLNPYPYHNLGSIYYLSNNFTQAERFWKRAIELQPDVSDPYIKLIKLYIMQKRAPDALYYTRLLKDKGVDIIQQVTQALQQAIVDSTK